MKSGFSLIEVLVTLAILSIGITTISALMSGNIRTSISAKNQIIASQLAQEGLELVRNLKDNNSGFAEDVSDNNDYRVDYNSTYDSFRSSNNIDQTQKKLNLNGGYFLHSAGTATKFLRKIRISTSSDGDKVAESLVSWNGSTIPAVCNVANKCVSMKAVLPVTEPKILTWQFESSYPMTMPEDTGEASPLGMVCGTLNAEKTVTNQCWLVEDLGEYECVSSVYKCLP